MCWKEEREPGTDLRPGEGAEATVSEPHPRRLAGEQAVLWGELTRGLGPLQTGRDAGCLMQDTDGAGNPRAASRALGPPQAAEQPFRPALPGSSPSRVSCVCSSPLRGPQEGLPLLDGSFRWFRGHPLPSRLVRPAYHPEACPHSTAPRALAPSPHTPRPSVK